MNGMKGLPWFSFKPHFRYAPEGDGNGNSGDSKETADSAVDKAAKEIDEGGKKTDDSEGKKDEKKSSKDDADEPTEEELQELAHAQNLVKLLRDPVAKKALIRTLAEQEGLVGDSTKEEKKAAAKELKDHIAEILGDDYKFLVPKLQQIMEVAESAWAEKHVKPLRDGISSKEAKVAETAFDAAYEKVGGEFKEFKTLEAEMAKISKQYKADEGMSAEAYVRELVILAANRKGINLTKVEAGKKDVKSNFLDERRDKNRNNAGGRLSSEREEKGTKTELSKKTMSFDEAVAKAAALLEEEQKKD